MAKGPQLITPKEKIDQLTPFEGSPVIATSLEVRGINGGFNDGLTVDPAELRHGSKVFLLVEGTIDDILHKPIKDQGSFLGWRRAHVIRVEAGTIVDGAFAEGQLEEMRVRIEEAQGIQRLKFDEDLLDEHQAGKHAGALVDGCVECQKEVAAAAAEAGAGTKTRDDRGDGTVTNIKKAPQKAAAAKKTTGK